MTAFDELARARLAEQIIQRLPGVSGNDLSDLHVGAGKVNVTYMVERIWADGWRPFASSAAGIGTDALAEIRARAERALQELRDGMPLPIGPAMADHLASGGHPAATLRLLDLVDEVIALAARQVIADITEEPTT